MLNTGREQNPTEAIIWITGAQLEEAAGWAVLMCGKLLGIEVTYSVVL